MIDLYRILSFEILYGTNFFLRKGKIEKYKLFFRIVSDAVKIMYFARKFSVENVSKKINPMSFYI